MSSERLPEDYVLRQNASGMWKWGRLAAQASSNGWLVPVWSDRYVPTVSRAIRLAREDQFARERDAA